jgi:pimeloyl-ACP methyl ester carboxylesterase
VLKARVSRVRNRRCAHSSWRSAVTAAATGGAGVGRLGFGGFAVLIGHSYGGAVITEAGNHPNVGSESISTLIAKAPPGAPTSPTQPPRDGLLFQGQDRFAAAFAVYMPARSMQGYLGQGMANAMVGCLLVAADAVSVDAKKHVDGVPSATGDGASGRREGPRSRRREHGVAEEPSQNGRKPSGA